MANRIEIVRGTTNIFDIDISDNNGNPYTLAYGEFLVFGIKKVAESNNLLIAKKVQTDEKGGYYVQLDPADTENLCCAKYFYDLGLQSGENFYNVVEATPFVILPNITKKGCVE